MLSDEQKTEIKNITLRLEVIGEMRCPRDNWAANLEVSREEGKRLIKHMMFGTISFWSELLDYPDESEIDYDCDAGHPSTEDDRRGDLAALKKRSSSADAKLAFDGKLCFIHSESEHSVTFTSNVEPYRIEGICRELRANTIMFPHRWEHGIVLNIISFTRDVYLKELDDEQLELERTIDGLFQSFAEHQDRFFSEILERPKS